MENEFRIEFISPLLIGGFDSRGLDETGLRGASLRGCWRFWCRALLGGMINCQDHSQLLDLENRLFGSTDKAVFRLRINKLYGSKKRFARLPHRDRKGAAFRDGLHEGSFQVTLAPRLAADANNLAQRQSALLAAIWLWGNLGAIGNRCRRGFGSPVLAPVSEKTNPFAPLDLPLALEFKTSQDLAKHLREGLEKTWGIFDEWIKTEITEKHPLEVVPKETFTDAGLDPGRFKFFTLRSQKQILISTDSPSYNLGCDDHPVRNGLMAKIHGSSKANPELGFVDKRERHASPAFIRLHKVNGGWLAICTLSQAEALKFTNKAEDYLSYCGFKKSLLEK